MREGAAFTTWQESLLLEGAILTDTAALQRYREKKVFQREKQDPNSEAGGRVVGSVAGVGSAL